MQEKRTRVFDYNVKWLNKLKYVKVNICPSHYAFGGSFKVSVSAQLKVYNMSY